VVTLIIIVVALAAAAGAYFWWSQSRPVTIGQILRDLRHYDGQTVTIRGKVVSAMNVLVLRYFEVSDNTGDIKVVTKRGLPNVGDTVTVHGIVHQVFTIRGMDWTVIEELGPGEAASFRLWGRRRAADS
jgi:RecJ-like exonuclease